jgi:predicted nucleic acid-binding protein
VTRLFELSGKKSTGKKYNDNYAKFWIAHNAMLSLIKTWLKHTRYKDIWKGAFEIARCDPNLAPMLYRLK